MEKQTNEQLLRQIDKLELSDRIKAWQAEIKNAPSKVYAERQKLALESWKETEGEDIELRRAKLFKNIVENVPIKIHDFDVLVGRLTPGVIGACTAMDANGDYIPDIWENTDELHITVSNEGALTKEERDILRESAAYFRGKTAPDKVNEAWRDLLGSWPADYEAAKGKDPSMDAGIFPGCTSTVMFEKILTKGLRGIIAEARQNISDFIDQRKKGGDSVVFWKSCVIVLEACINHAHRYADLAEQMAGEEKNAARAAELREIARICRKVPESPAETFQEALQSMAIVGVCKNLEHPMHAYPQWGRGDQYLYPFFRNDIGNGTITVDRAAELLEELIGRWGTQIFILSVSMKQSHQVNFAINDVNISGVDKYGADASNELSYLFLQAVSLLKQSSPTVALRWNKDTPKWLMEKAIETNLHTRGGIPLFESDESVIRHFVEDGIPAEEAREWIGLGCVYPTLPSRVEHYGMEGVAAVNLAVMFDMAMHNGIVPVTGKKLGLETGDPRAFKSFDALLEAFKKQHKFVIDRTLWLGGIGRDVEQKWLRLPFLSSVASQGGMDAGKDVLVPDPAYHIFGMSDRALVDVADSLLAVKKLVFDEKKLTMSELLEAIDSNFGSRRGEEIRQMCLAVPKFGNDNDEIDNLVKELGEFSAGVIRAYDDSPFSGYKVISREGLSWHYLGGLGVGALPNGRKALEPLDDGSISPMRGADVNGPTAVLRSVLKTSKESYASVLNQKFSSSVVNTPENREKLAIFTDTFLRNGGTHIQYNISDAAELQDAVEHPENHRDLIVRVGGFSAYFVQLTPEIQNDVIMRTEQSI
jgi:formate C-acetyltransferase